MSNKEAGVLFESNKGFIRGYLLDSGYYFITEYSVNKAFAKEKGIADEFLSKLPKKCMFIAYPKKEGASLDEIKVLIRYYEKKGFTCVDRNLGLMKRG